MSYLSDASPMLDSNTELDSINWSQITQLIRKDFSQAREILKEAGVCLKALAPLKKNPQGTEPYGRKVLYASGEFEIMLATWAVGAECHPHDHGFSNGAVWIVEGHFTESNFRLRDELEKIGQDRQWNVDDVIPVGVGGIHSMVAPVGGVTLHLYSPPIHEMKVFDPASRTTLTVTDDCGAWVPTDSKQIVSRESW